MNTTATTLPATTPVDLDEAEITPDRIAAIAAESLKSCKKAASDLRDLAQQLGNMSQKVEGGIVDLANDFDAHGAAVAESAVEHAKYIVETGKYVSQLRDHMPRRPKPKPPNGAGHG